MLRPDRQPVEPAEERRQPGRHAEAGLVGPVVGCRPEEVVELGAPLGDPLADVHLRHRQLVHVGEQRPAGRRPSVDDPFAEPGHTATPRVCVAILGVRTAGKATQTSGRGHVGAPITVTSASSRSARTRSVVSASGDTGRVASHSTAVSNPAAAALERRRGDTHVGREPDDDDSFDPAFAQQAGEAGRDVDVAARLAHRERRVAVLTVRALADDRPTRGGSDRDRRRARRPRCRRRSASATRRRRR